MKSHAEDKPPVVENETPHLPWFRTWRGVYLFVIGCFVLYVILLAILSRTYL